MWSAEWSGEAHRFHLAGINNQNFLMRDETTGSWWQQSTGKAIMGPLKGQELAFVPFEELSFGAWRAENPTGRVLAPDPALLEAKAYAKPDWEERVAKLPVVTTAAADEPFEPRELIIGVARGDALRAYAMSALKADRVMLDDLGGTPIALVLGDDGRSVRVFERRAGGRELELFLKPDTTPLRLIDGATGSEWTFGGLAVSGELAGQSLPRVQAIPSYWFDWKQQHPGTGAWGGSN